MTQYRKKPVVIEAVRFDGSNPAEIKDFVGENCEVDIYDNRVIFPVAHIVIHTLEGDMEVSKGDYVIKGVKGEFYPCKPDIFQQTYESAETQQEQPEIDLEEAAEEYAQLDDEGVWKDGGKYKGFIAGAKWQKSQMLKDGNIILAEEDFDAEKEKSMEWGYNLCKEQMMKNAMEGQIYGSDGDHWVESEIYENLKGKEGDKVRIVVLKEDGDE